MKYRTRRCFSRERNPRTKSKFNKWPVFSGNRWWWGSRNSEWTRWKCSIRAFPKRRRKSRNKKRRSRSKWRLTTHWRKWLNSPLLSTEATFKNRRWNWAISFWATSTETPFARDSLSTSEKRTSLSEDPTNTSSRETPWTILSTKLPETSISKSSSKRWSKQSRTVWASTPLSNYPRVCRNSRASWHRRWRNIEIAPRSAIESWARFCALWMN